MTTFRIIGLFLVFCAPLLGACGGAAPDDFVPAGVAQGQPTFVYLFTEN